MRITMSRLLQSVMKCAKASALVIACGCVFTLTGCFRLSRNTPPTQFFVLSGGASASTPSGAAPSTTSAQAGGSVTLGLRRLDLAAYLATPAIVVRKSAHQIHVSEFHRWGEELGQGINRTLASQLSNAPPVKAVSVAPWQPSSQHDFLVQLHVYRFEGVADSAATTGGIHVHAAWDIIQPRGGTVLVRGNTDYREGNWTAGDYEGLVSQLNAAISRVAQDIRGCLSRFRSDTIPPPSCGSGEGR